MAAGLVLHQDVVTAAEGGEAVGVLIPSCSAEGLALGKGSLAVREGTGVSRGLAEFGGEAGEQVSRGADEKAHGRGHLRVGAGAVAILQEGRGLEGATRSSFAGD